MWSARGSEHVEQRIEPVDAKGFPLAVCELRQTSEERISRPLPSLHCQLGRVQGIPPPPEAAHGPRTRLKGPDPRLQLAEGFENVVLDRSDEDGERRGLRQVHRHPRA